MIREVTLGQLASHTSGLLLPTDHPPWPEHNYTLEGFIRALNAWRLGGGPSGSATRTPILTPAMCCCSSRWSADFGLPIGQLIDQRVLKLLGILTRRPSGSSARWRARAVARRRAGLWRGWRADPRSWYPAELL